MEKIIVIGFDQLRKELTGECVKSELYWAENVEDFHHLKNGEYATTQTPTKCFTEVWIVNGKQINLTKYVRNYGKWTVNSKKVREFTSGVISTEYVVAGIEDNEVLVSYKPELSQAASFLGKLGGSAKTEAKARASRENGKLGGRPKKAE